MLFRLLAAFLLVVSLAFTADKEKICANIAFNEKFRYLCLAYTAHVPPDTEACTKRGMQLYYSLIREEGLSAENAMLISTGCAVWCALSDVKNPSHALRMAIYVECIERW